MLRGCGMAGRKAASFRSAWDHRSMLNPASHQSPNGIQAFLRLLSSYYGFRNPGARLSESSVFLQSGNKISELPLVVTKVNNVFDLYKRLGIQHSASALQPAEEAKFTLTFPNNMEKEEMEIIAGFNRCFNSDNLFRLLETIPRNEVTPSVAVHALRRIIDLENNKELPSAGSMRSTLRGVKRKAGQETFMRVAFITMLIEIVTTSKQPGVILDGLRSMMRDQFPPELATYKEVLVEELLVCVSEGIFSVEEVCQAVNILSGFYEDRKKCLEAADRLWFGIVDQYKDLDSPQNVVAVFGALPFLTKSRSIILKILEKKGVERWEEYQPADVIEILRVLTEIKYDSVDKNFLGMIAEWFALNIHKVTETEMLAIVYSFWKLDFINDKLINTMEKLVKHRGCKIKEVDLVCTICDFCLDHRVRSSVILEGTSQYFVYYIDKLTVPQIYSMARIFGCLDFHPTTGFKFWLELERVLQEKFVQFKPVEIIHLLNSFMYIEKYPLNFATKLFNPYFLDRLHSQQHEEVQLSRRELKLLDAGLKLGCHSYGGPYLPKDTSLRQLNLDFRVRKTAKRLFEPLGEVIGNFDRIGTQVLLSSLPLHPSFVCDMMIYPTRAAALLRFGFKTQNSSNIAVLILLPEHYDRTGEHLLGPQLQRIRHLKTMGFRVMTVDYDKVQSPISQEKLKDYLRKRFNLATAKTRPP